MKLIRLLGLPVLAFVILSVLAATELCAADHGPSVPPDEALARLNAGNERFAHTQPALPKSFAARRVEIVGGQHPFAVILGCSDSRVPPEIVFDEGLGDLFVVRTAGNVANSDNIASIEYAVKHLGSALIVVLGHERCGAVDAAVHDVQEKGSLPKLLKAIRPAVLKAEKQKGNLLENAVRQNVLDVVNRLNTDQPILAPLVKSGSIRIVGAYYNLETGAVRFFDKPKSD